MKHWKYLTITLILSASVYDSIYSLENIKRKLTFDDQNEETGFYPKKAKLNVCKNIDLIGAVYAGNKAEIKQALKAGVSDDTKNQALLAAIYMGKTQISEFLLNHGADANSKDKMGYSALMTAAYMDHKDIITLLLSRGAIFNNEDEVLNYIKHINPEKAEKIQETIKTLEQNLAKEVLVSKINKMLPKIFFFKPESNTLSFADAWNEATQNSHRIHIFEQALVFLENDSKLAPIDKIKLTKKDKNKIIERLIKLLSYQSFIPYINGEYSRRLDILQV